MANKKPKKIDAKMSNGVLKINGKSVLIGDSSFEGTFDSDKVRRDLRKEKENRG